MKVVKSNLSTWTLLGNNSFGGGLLVNGGSLILKDDGMLSSNSGTVELNYATLTLDNNGWKDLPNRVATGALRLRGGTLNYISNAQTAAVGSLGALTAVEGFSTFNITLSAAPSGVNSADLTLGTLNVLAGSGAMLNFNAPSLGQAGNAARLLLSGGAAPALVNGILPGALLEARTLRPSRRTVPPTG